MKKILALLLTLSFVASAHAQPVAVGKRNDGFATTLQGNNLGNMPLGADEKGRVGALNWLNSRTTIQPTVAVGTPVAQVGDKTGRAITTLGQFREFNLIQPVVTLTNTTAETTLIASSGGGSSNDITLIACVNTSATPVRIDVRKTTGGAVQFPLYIPAGDMRGYGDPTLIIGSANSNWTIQSSASVTDVRCWATYMINF